VSDVNDNVELLYPDAKVTAVLCGGGPCIYVVSNPAVDATMIILSFSATLCQM
jgi:hypothetical protein